MPEYFCPICGASCRPNDHQCNTMADSMKTFYVYFYGNRSGSEMRIDAYSAKQAREIFAAYRNVLPSRLIGTSSKQQRAA